MARFPAFDDPVPSDGYAWWYIDAISDDGAQALTLIAFIGSVFSPYYAWARRCGSAAATDHCAVNLALYHPPSRWCMTERGQRSLRASADVLAIGPSRLHRRGGKLIVDIDEITVPWPRRLRGRLSISLPDAAVDPVWIDMAQNHAWQPIAPQTRIKVEMQSPALTWHGNAYVDSNRGRVPLEQTFRRWQWSRCHLDACRTLIQYDLTEHDGIQRDSTFIMDDTTLLEAAPGMPAQRQRLASTRWFRIPRQTRVDPGAPVNTLQTLEDTPFYARSRFRTTVLGHECECVHESLDLNRFDHPLTRCLLPFRMPRRATATPLPTRLST